MKIVVAKGKNLEGHSLFVKFVKQIEHESK